MIEWSEFWRIFSLVFLLTAIPVAIMIVWEKRSPFKTAAWILVLILLPIFGVVFYLIFGQEYRKRKLFSRSGIKSLGKIRRLSTKQLREFEQTHLHLDKKIREKEKIIRLLLNNSSALLTTGNKLKILNGGEQTFDAIFEAIQSASHHIHLEYYILADDKIGRRLKNLLIAKSRQGVEVRIIIDDVGSWGLGNKNIEEFRKNGVEIYPFMEVHFPRLTSQVNFRNHRKIVIVDGKIGFTGGINVADRYIEGIKKIGPWRDTHLQLEGDAVACLQVVFAADWYFVINENINGRKYFPAFSEAPGTAVQISASGPDSDWENIGQAFFAAITNARKRVYIVTPYLMPPPNIVSALKMTSLSNVDVRIIIPKKSDAIIPRWCSFSYVEELMEAGIRIFFYEAGFIHSKYIIVDDVFSSVGTTNLDFRSLETNFEVNAFIYDEEFTAELEKTFTVDLKNSYEITLEEWQQRPWHKKFRESLAHIFSPML
ncbi:cardiolipin synthase [Maribellus comscasis]|uniref:Cardiolipin synthase n=1 Tax=Maribellus comscasis TaxID=2681766 RepID=A0A6I6JXR2_9BACT|nr:cardiolipin synthase [Maribellus comscasis]QGY44932.1 cardiolipin synthase [Maribellus comscasis]